ncbi:hypothetical protein PR202_ga00198 [Eleusine coracana subsp. coracana]|uniref:Uncharacterized protein n=1 Tax=Eleusine coracana subsp. coracana TaxID=191504 RepID=A0AAV5BFV2_ELECO|nr:hypothetical protein PR202_ga00198 [Eleusine coracana subsp. coracana]
MTPISSRMAAFALKDSVVLANTRRMGDTFTDKEGIDATLERYAAARRLHRIQLITMAYIVCFILYHCFDNSPGHEGKVGQSFSTLGAVEGAPYMAISKLEVLSRLLAMSMGDQPGKQQLQ